MRGIPDFRLNKQDARREMERLAKAGIRFEFNAKLDPADLDDMLKHYDRIVVATGLQIPKILPLEGWRSESILYAVNMMEKVNSGKEVRMHGNVVVIGRGSVAMDTARAALRLGAEKVTVMCLECGDDIPAHKWEIKEAQEEGIEVISGVSPTRFQGASYRLDGVEYVQIRSLDPKTCRFDKVEGTEKMMPADFVIIATGQRSDKDWKERKNVVLAGDIAGGKCSVIDAMASGRAAALQIDNELMGRTYEEYKVERRVNPGERKYKVYPATRLKLKFEGVRELGAEERKKTFDIVELGLDGDEARLEVQRCLSCGYRYIETEQCIGCGVCQKVCPKGDVISMIAVPENARKGK